MYSLGVDHNLQQYWHFEGHICKECSKNPILGVDNRLRITVDYLAE